MKINIINFNLCNIILFILLYLSNSIFCYIIIPIKYITYNELNETNPRNIMNNIINQNLYGILEIVSPKQKVDVRIEFDSNNFYISKNNSFIHNDENKIFSKLKKYNSYSSNSLTILEEGILFNDDNLIMTSVAKDYVYFNDGEYEIEFLLAEVLEYPSTGGIGLQISNSGLSKFSFLSFLAKIKNIGLGDNYSWTIIYNNKKEGYDGYLLLGDYLHNINNKDIFINNQKIYEDSLYSIYSYSYENIIKRGFYMDELTILKLNGKVENIKDKKYLYVELDYNFGGIVGPNYIEFYLDNTIFPKDNICKKNKFLLESKVYFFYYCKNDNSIIQKIKNNFPKISFVNIQFNYNFTIDPNDLFIEKNEYVYCLMVFSLNENNGWKLGRPFLQKYQFMFEQDTKKIHFYSYKNKVDINGVKKSTLVKIIVVLSIVFLILGFCIGRIIYRRHFKKQRINELDDNFEYKINENNEKKIEMTRKLF